MSLIPFPSADCLTDFSLMSHANQRASASPFGGSEQVVDMLNDRWHVNLGLPPAQGAASARFEAFLASMRGQVNWTNLHHFGRPVPLGTLASSQGLVLDAAQGAASITIATTSGATLLAGDMLGVDGLLLQCSQNCTADANGVLVVPLANRLRRALTGLRRASTATFIDGAGVLQTAAVNVPRYQGGQLLVEGAATNVVPQSNNFSDASWSKVNSTISSGVVGPDGVTASSKLVATVSGAVQHRVERSPTLGAGVQTLSVFAKAAELSFITLRIDSGGLAFVYNVATASVAGAAAGMTASVIPLADGWCRCVLTWVSAPANPICRINLHTGTLLDFAGDGVSGVHIFGAQLVAGSSPSSYIPTTATTATRSADIITPVVWDRPTAPFRLVGRPALRYVPGYSEGLSLDFVEKVD